MLEIGDALNSSSLFAGVIGLLFSTWVTDIGRAIELKMPAHYLDRKKYFGEITSPLLTKALPLSTILLAFVYANSGIALSITDQSNFYNIFARDQKINIEWTIFILVYFAMVYFLVITMSATANLISALMAARKGRKANDPRISLLG